MRTLRKALVDTRLYDAELREGERLRRYLKRIKRGGGESEEETEIGKKQGVKIDNSEWRQQEFELEPP